MKTEEYIKNYIKSKSDLEHSLHVEKICLELFHQLQKIFPNNKYLYFKNADKLISYSAKLHDIGSFLENKSIFKPHNKTGAKLVLENGIDDLDDTELKIVALSIRHHRGSKPKEGKHKLYSSLEQKDKNAVLFISSIIRMADALDKNHFQTAENILLTYDFDHFTLTLNSGINIMFNVGVERVFNKKKTLFEELFKVKICLKNDAL